MDKEDFSKITQTDIVYDRKEYNKIISSFKHNICQNIRIARKLSNKSPKEAAILLGLEPESLRRIEALNDRDDISLRVLILAIMVYNPDANFYFNNWEENEKLLNDIK